MAEFGFPARLSLSGSWVSEIWTTSHIPFSQSHAFCDIPVNGPILKRPLSIEGAASGNYGLAFGVEITDTNQG